MDKKGLFATVAIALLRPEEPSKADTAPHLQVSVATEAELTEERQHTKEQVLVQAETVDSNTETKMSDEIKNKLLERRKAKNTNTEKGFKKTAEILQIHLRRSGFPFKLIRDESSPNVCGLHFSVDAEHTYYLSLPEPEEINPDSEYNVLFEEYEWEEGLWELKDHEVVNSNTIQSLEDEIVNVLGGKATEEEDEEAHAHDE